MFEIKKGDMVAWNPAAFPGGEDSATYQNSVKNIGAGPFLVEEIEQRKEEEVPSILITSESYTGFLHGKFFKLHLPEGYCQECRQERKERLLFLTKYFGCHCD